MHRRKTFILIGLTECETIGVTVDDNSDDSISDENSTNILTGSLRFSALVFCYFCPHKIDFRFLNQNSRVLVRLIKIFLKKIAVKEISEIILENISAKSCEIYHFLKV